MVKSTQAIFHFLEIYDCSLLGFYSSLNKHVCELYKFKPFALLKSFNKLNSKRLIEVCEHSV